MIRDPEFLGVEEHDLGVVVKEDPIECVKHKLGEVVKVPMPWEPWHIGLQCLLCPPASMVVAKGARVCKNNAYLQELVVKIGLMGGQKTTHKTFDDTRELPLLGLRRIVDANRGFLQDSPPPCLWCWLSNDGKLDSLVFFNTEKRRQGRNDVFAMILSTVDFGVVNIDTTGR